MVNLYYFNINYISNLLCSYYQWPAKLFFLTLEINFQVKADAVQPPTASWPLQPVHPRPRAIPCHRRPPPCLLQLSSQRVRWGISSKTTGQQFPGKRASKVCKSHLLIQYKPNLLLTLYRLLERTSESDQVRGAALVGVQPSPTLFQPGSWWVTKNNIKG